MLMNGLKRQIYLVDKQAQGEFFQEMILPSVWDKINESDIFLIGALEGEQVIGAAVFQLESTGAQLLSVAVEASRRRQGIGSALLQMCVRVLRRTSIQALYTILTEDETEAAALVSSFGMECSDANYKHYTILLKDVAALPALQDNKNKTYALEDVSDLMLKRFLNTVFPSNPKLVQKESFEPKVSRFFIENAQITACLLAGKTEDGLSLAWLSSQSKNKLSVLYLIQDALAAAVAAYPEDTNISFTGYEGTVVRLVEGLLGDITEKRPIKEWILKDYDFRLKDTSLTDWEVL